MHPHSTVRPKQERESHGQVKCHPHHHSKHQDDSTVANMPGHGRTFDRFLSATGRHVDRLIAKLRNFNDSNTNEIAHPTPVSNYLPQGVATALPTRHQQCAGVDFASFYHRTMIQTQASFEIRKHEHRWLPTYTAVDYEPELSPLPADTSALIIKANYRCLATFSALEMARRDARLRNIAQMMWSAVKPLGMEPYEAGRIIIRRTVDAKLYNDLLRLNATIDRLTLEIIQGINVNFIFELPKPMMNDILDLYKSPENSAWIEKILVTRERIDSISSLYHEGASRNGEQHNNFGCERQQATRYPQSSVDAFSLHDIHDTSPNMDNPVNSESMHSTIHTAPRRVYSVDHATGTEGHPITNARLTGNPSRPHPDRMQSYNDESYSAPAVTYGFQPSYSAMSRGRFPPSHNLRQDKATPPILVPTLHSPVALYQGNGSIDKVFFVLNTIMARV